MLGGQVATSYFYNTYAYIYMGFPGEGNGKPFQYSCLGNPRAEEPGQLQFIGSQRVGHHLSTKPLYTHTHRHTHI